MEYHIWRHEGGKKVKKEGPFADKEKANERCSELNEKINIGLGGFKVHEE